MSIVVWIFSLSLEWGFHTHCGIPPNAISCSVPKNECDRIRIPPEKMCNERETRIELCRKDQTICESENKHIYTCMGACIEIDNTQ